MAIAVHLRGVTESASNPMFGILRNTLDVVHEMNLKGQMYMKNDKTICITEELISRCHQQLVRSIAVAEIAQELDLPIQEVLSSFETAVAESRQTLSLLRNIELPFNARILEVGAGYGLASICLAMMEFDVTALEPGGLGFEKNRAASLSFAEQCGVRLNHLMESAEVADFSKMEKFDLIISNNVLEHIPDFNTALTNLTGAINPGGIMIHSCPNYTFPFEPHFGIPLVPFMPRLTRHFLPKSVSTSGLWKSLNFINQSQVKRNAHANGMSCIFKAGTMSNSIKRINEDPQFAERHQIIARFVKIRFVYVILVRLFSLPPRIATPMEFLVCVPEQSESSNVQTWMGSR